MSLRVRGLASLNKIMTPQLLDDAAVTLVEDDGRLFTITPTTTRIITLPTTGILAGESIEIHNFAATEKITIESSDGDDIASFQDGHMVLMAKQDTPTDRTHWEIVRVSGGASPSFYAHRDNVNQTNITGFDVVEFDSIASSQGFDNNNNYNVTTFKFEPSVPGTYMIGAFIEWSALVASDALDFYILLNSTTFGKDSMEADNTVNETQSTSGISIANGSTDDFNVAAQNAGRDTSSILGLKGSSGFWGYRIGN